MNDLAYDISHLLALESELAHTAASAPRSTRSTRPTAAKSHRSTVAEAQDALSRELMQNAEIHDALVQQYLRTNDNPFMDNPFQDVGGADDR